MPDSPTYQRICKQECKLCAKGIGFLGTMHDCPYPSALLPCTAPTKDAVIDALFQYYEETHNAAGMGYPSHRLKDVAPNQTAVIDVIERQAKRIEELESLLVQAGNVITALQFERPAGGILDRIDAALESRGKEEPNA